MDEVILSRITKEAYEKGYADGKVDGYNLASKAISPQRKTGKWIQNTTYPMIGSDAVVAEAYCSECELYSSQINAFGYVTYDICPRCGAEMKGEEDE